MVNRKREVYKHKRKIIRRIAINEFNIEGHMKSIGYRTAWIQRGTAGNRHFAAQSYEKFHAG